MERKMIFFIGKFYGRARFLKAPMRTFHVVSSLKHLSSYSILYTILKEIAWAVPEAL